MKRFTLFLFITAEMLQVNAQAPNSLMSYGGGRTGAGSCLFRDYQTIGINPANLGIYECVQPIVTTGFMDACGLFYSDALPKSEVLPSLFGRNGLSSEEQREIARLFLETGNNFTAEVMMVGLVVQFPKFAGIGFSWRERMVGGAIFSQPLADIVFNGINSDYIDTIVLDIVGNQIGIFNDTLNSAELFNGSSFQYNWLREYNISIGRKLLGDDNFSIYLGGAIKFLQSNAIADITFSSDTITGFAAFSKLFDIDYANFTDPDFQLEGRFSPVGRGIGFDIGATIVLSNKFYGAVSVNDIGSLKYSGNLVTIDDAITDSLINFIGINYATIFADLETLFNADGLFQYLPSAEKKVVLPTLLRVGVGWNFNEHLDFAAEVMNPLNSVPGSLPKVQFAGLVNFKPVENVKISAGITGGGIADVDVPAGISFSLVPHQVWQLGIGTGDVISLIKQDRPSVSLNLSLMRFHYE